MNAEDRLPPTPGETIFHVCRGGLKERCAACRQRVKDRPSPCLSPARPGALTQAQPATHTSDALIIGSEPTGMAGIGFSPRMVSPETPDASLNQNPSVRMDETNFESQVLQSKLPVLVAFYAPWSRPCQILNSSLDQIVPLCAGRAKVVRVNADDHPYLSLRYAIHSIPTLLFFVNGNLRAKIVGAVPGEHILSQLRAFFPGGCSQPLPLGTASGGKPFEFDDW